MLTTLRGRVLTQINGVPARRRMIDLDPSAMR
jgi:hypothetical protein